MPIEFFSFQRPKGKPDVFRAILLEQSPWSTARTGNHGRALPQLAPQRALVNISISTQIELGPKILQLWLGLRTRRLNAITETSKLPNHLPRAQLLGAFGDCRSSLLVANSLVQDQPDQSTLSMSDGSNGLIVPQARD